MMKIKSGLLTSAVVLGMALPLALPVVANAADTAATSAAKSASVTVNPGELTITKTGTDDVDQMAPSFKFGDASVSTKTQTVSPLSESDGGFKNVINSDDSYSGSKLSVDDNSGTGGGWHVTAQLAALSDGATTNSHDLAGAVLHMVGSGATSDDSTKAATAPKADLSAGGDAATIFNAKAGNGMGNSTADFSGSSLTLPTATIKGTYTAALTYTLTSGPDDNVTA